MSTVQRIQITIDVSDPSTLLDEATAHTYGVSVASGANVGGVAVLRNVSVETFEIVSVPTETSVGTFSVGGD